MAKNNSGGSRRGFAAMDAKKQREIAAKGGRASRGGRKANRQTSMSADGTQNANASDMM